MLLLDLARRWLKPGAKAETDEDRAEEYAFRKRAGEIWLAYHDNEAWAQRKLDAGLNLTPEGLDYMAREIEARKRVEAHHRDLLKETHDEPAHVPPASDVGSLFDGDGAVDGCS